jgi:hypothetical protein
MLKNLTYIRFVLDWPAKTCNGWRCQQAEQVLDNLRRARRVFDRTQAGAPSLHLAPHCPSPARVILV